MLRDRFGVLRHQRPREVELRLHDREPILLEHERGRPPLAECLTLADELGEPASQGVAAYC